MRKILTSAVILLLISVQVLKSELKELATMISIEAPVLEDFEDQKRASEWIIGETSPNIAKEWITPDQKKQQLTLKPIPTHGTPLALAVPTNRKQWCLGLKAAFKTKGYNFIEILPPVFSMDKYSHLKPLFPFEVPNPYGERFIPIPGKCKRIELWVAGRNYNYTVEIWLEDFNGFIYPLEMGSINYAGWRCLSKPIPGYIPQEEKYIPQEKPLKVKKIVVRADPNERADRLYVYFDHLKVITDLYIKRFDGDFILDTW